MTLSVQESIKYCRYDRTLEVREILDKYTIIERYDAWLFIAGTLSSSESIFLGDEYNIWGDDSSREIGEKRFQYS